MIKRIENGLATKARTLLPLAMLIAGVASATEAPASAVSGISAGSASPPDFPLPPETVAQLAVAREACGALGQVVETLEASGQGQYSRMSYEVVRHALDAIENEDIPGGWTNRVVREARELASMAPRALEKAKRIASGEERDMPVPRFKSGPVVARGCIVHGRRQWPDGRVEEDCPVMLNGWGHFRDAPRDVGFLNRIGGNFLQQEVKFRDLEQERGVVRAEVLDELAATLRGSLHADTPVDFLLSSHYMPKWATEDGPDQETCKNGFMKFCIHDQRMVEAVTGFQTRAASFLKDAPGLVAFCLSNEPASGDVSKCLRMKELWAEHLAARFGTVDRMNALWRTNYADFGSVEMPPFPDLPRTPLGLEFVRCDRKVLAEFHGRMIAAVKAVAPDVPLHAKLVADKSLEDPTGRYCHHFWSNDAMRFAEMFDWLDHDSAYFPEADGPWPNTWIAHQMASDFLRSFADKPLMDSENHVIPDNSAGVDVSPEHCYSALWQEAVHGVRMSAIWCWQRGTKDEPWFNGMPTERPECLEAMGRCQLDLARLSDELAPIQSEPPTVLVLWSLSSMVLDERHASAPAAVYAAASFLGEPLGFVTEEFLERFAEDGVMRRPLDSARAIILPGVTHLPDSSVEALKRLEAAGIRILAVGPELEKDDFGRPRGPTPWQSANRTVQGGKTRNDGTGATFGTEPELVAKILFQAMEDWDLPARPRLMRPTFGVETHGYGQGGVRRLALCNHLREPVEVELEAEGTDLLTMAPTGWRLTLPSMQPVFVEFSKNQPLSTP